MRMEHSSSSYDTLTNYELLQIFHIVVLQQIKRLQSDMQHKQSQFKHEVKKKEKENQRLKERLHGVLTDKNKDKKLGE